MADRRMISAGVIGSDDFVELPCMAQALYVHLCCNADDDGFVNAPRKVARSIGADLCAIDALIVSGHLYVVDGVAVIRHWLHHNQIRKDRYNPTVYQSIFSRLSVTDDIYYLNDPDLCGGISKPCGEASIPCGEASIPCGEVLEARCLGKVSIGQVSVGNISCSEQIPSELPDPVPDVPDVPAVIELPLNNGAMHKIYEDDVRGWEQLYPAVDVRQQLRSMRGWLDSHPKKRKTSRGIAAFITSWLAKEQDRGPRAAAPPPVLARNAQYQQHGGEVDMEAIQRIISRRQEGGGQ